jgi:hypothetical protein
MTWSIDSVFVPEAELRRLRELALERYPQVRERDKIERACLAGAYDHLVRDELAAFRPREWSQLLELCERHAVKTLRADGRSDPEIEIKLILDGDEPDRLVSAEVLAEILAANPQIAGNADVRRALDRLDAPPVTDDPAPKPSTSSEAPETHAQEPETHAQEPIRVTEPLDLPSPSLRAEKAESASKRAPEAGPGSPFVWRSEKNRGPGLLPDKF